MSQPPQQPGPYGGQQPGWDQQPGAGQQPGGYPQQGGYPQSGGYPQQGGYPQTGPQPQQQPGGYGQPGQPGQYGQQPPYGQPGAYDPQGFGKKKSPLPWILAGGGVVVIAVVVVLILVLTGGSSTSSPQATAESIVKAINDKDTAAAKKLYCDQEVANRSSEVGDLGDPPAEMSFSARTGNVTESGDTANVEVIITASARGKTQDFPIKFDLKKNGDSWCITGSKSDLGG